MAYQKQKDQEMLRREVAEADKQRLMKERQQKLLEGQQRDMDKRTELDELRARRAAEEKLAVWWVVLLAVGRPATELAAGRCDTRRCALVAGAFSAHTAAAHTASWCS
eukprot:8455-Heterococcus_DN1.PRE.2